MAASTNYTMTLTLAYVSLGDMTVSSALTGGALPAINRSYSDATPFTDFDTLALFSTSSMSTSMVFNSVNLSIVPEPNTSFLLLGAVAVVAVRRRVSPLQTASVS